MSDLPLNQILCGDCVEVLKDFPDNSIDLVVTDPPYGLSFMGKDWDKALPSREAFEQIIRVLKPGALAFVMSSPRQDLLWRMLALLEGVGFELNQSFMDWIYKTGFPKAYDVSKGIDAKQRRKYVQTAKTLGIIPKSLASWGDWTVREHSPSDKSWKEFKKVIPQEDWEKIEREVIGQNPNAIANTSNLYGYKMKGVDVSKPNSDLAMKWNGWKSQTGLKPAHEPILMVNKPFSEKTIVDNVLKWGTGAINVDVCRIPFQRESPEEFAKNFDDSRRTAPKFSGKYNQGKVGEYREQKPQIFTGRFPANLLVSDKALDTGEITQTDNPNRVPKTTGARAGSVSGNFGIKSGVGSEKVYSDSGDQSRYFDLDAWAEHHGFLDVPKPTTSERDYGLKGRKAVPKSKFNLNDGSKDERFDGAISLPRRNPHPTVKPIKLMAYLIELGCPPDGVVLDPFVGSGTTCIAAKKLVRKYVGIEINPEYVALAEARIRAYPVPFDWFNEESVGVPPRGGKDDA